MDAAHQITYRKLRRNIKNAKAIIDISPPQLQAGTFSRLTKVKEDVDTLLSRHRDNTRLLVAMNKYVRTKGIVDSFRTPENSITPIYNKIQKKLEWLEEVDKENLKIGRMIMSAKPTINTWLEKRYQRKNVQKATQVFQYPTLVMQKYSKMQILSDISPIKKFLRPKIWFDLAIKDVRPLGRIAIELYTEAAPQVVMEFVRLCFVKETERLQFIRLFPHLWLEGSLKLGDRTLMSHNIEFDKRSLDHGDDMGIMSFNVKHVLCSPRSTINFSISFKPLTVCNGRRVGFGRVYKGLRTLKSIEEYGNKNGKLYKGIVLTNCGFIH